MISTVPVQQSPVAVWLDRLVAVIVAAAGIAVVVLMLQVTPDPRGFDTHVQFGMQPCGWPAAYGAPCPTCGCTTAAANVVHGHLITAFVVQPFGAAACIALLVAAAFCLWALLRGRSVMDALGQLPMGTLLLGGTLLLLGSWLYKYLTFTPP